MHRRFFLGRGFIGALTALAALAARRVRADNFPKATKQQAGYVDPAGNHTFACAECTLFEPPSACKVVQGPISETATCIYFSH